MTPFFARFLLSGFLALTLLFTGCDSSASTQSAKVAVSAAGLPDFTGLVKANADSVVNISTTHTVQVSGPTSHDGMNRLLKRFFGDHFKGFHWQNEQQPSHPQSRDVRSLGSGFVVDADGYILTNYHVIKGADSILVRFNDRRQLPATVVGSDKKSDLALLKVDADHLDPVTIGSSKDLNVGEWVLAIGSPFGFSSTVTAGIVSAKHRSLPNENYVPFIQTDVAINPGNSGGPLFNLQGEVVGINSMIVSRSGGYMGLSFAIPIDLAMKVAKRLKAGKQVERGWLGVMIQPVTHDLAVNFGLDSARGALIAKVMPGSPAEAAGFKAGDVIVSFNGAPVPTAGALPPMVGLQAPGDDIDVGIVRQGEHDTLTVELGRLSDHAKATGNDSTTGHSATGLGLEVATLTDDDKTNADVDHGVKVTRIEPGPARQAGIRRGDIILSVNNQAVNDADEFAELLEEYQSSDSVALLVNHNGGTRFVVVHRKH